MSTAVNPIQKQEDLNVTRRAVVGGSDLHNLFNLEPYGCELRAYRLKTGQEPDVPFWGNSATDRGNELEPFAAKIYVEKTGRDIRRVQGKQHPTVAKFVPHPDYEILNNARGDEYGPGLLSIKVPGREMFQRLKAAIKSLNGAEPKTEWEKKTQEDGRKALMPYILQVQGEMAAFNRKWASFAIFWADGWQLEYFDIDRDGVVIKEIEDRVTNFWGMVESETEPEKLDPKSKQCSRCEFRVTCQSEHLTKLLQTDMGSSDFAIIPRLDLLVDTLRERQEIEEQATALVDETKDEIRELLSDCDAAEGTRVRIYNKVQEGRNSFQAEPFFKKHPELAEERKTFTKKGAPFRVLRVYDRPTSGKAGQ